MEKIKCTQSKEDFLTYHTQYEIYELESKLGLAIYGLDGCLNDAEYDSKNETMAVPELEMQGILLILQEVKKALNTLRYM